MKLHKIFIDKCKVPKNLKYFCMVLFQSNNSLCGPSYQVLSNLNAQLFSSCYRKVYGKLILFLGITTIVHLFIFFKSLQDPIMLCMCALPCINSGSITGVYYSMVSTTSPLIQLHNTSYLDNLFASTTAFIIKAPDII